MVKAARLKDTDGLPLQRVFDRRGGLPSGVQAKRRLVADAMRIARRVGYQSMTVWTFDALTAAGALYRDVGFTCTRSEQTRAFGKDMAEQVWDRAL